MNLLYLNTDVFKLVYVQEDMGKTRGKVVKCSCLISLCSSEPIVKVTLVIVTNYFYSVGVCKYILAFMCSYVEI